MITPVQKFVFVVLALAVLVQGLLPLGYMPKFGSEQVFAVTICRGADMVTINLNKDMQPVEEGSHTSSASSCIFAQLPSPFTPSTYHPIDFITIAYQIYHTDMDSSDFSEPSSTRPYFSQAPPVIV